ncbi:hypothetical protein K439DRAFT_1621608 [Ramaria rubella]|nr:hypothetical protein K439DRAFT_1621608 [Ramaria rubella]
MDTIDTQTWPPPFPTCGTALTLMTDPDRATEWEVQSAAALHPTYEMGPLDNKPYAQRQPTGTQHRQLATANGRLIPAAGAWSPDECHHERHVNATTCGMFHSTATTPPAVLHSARHSTWILTPNYALLPGVHMF